MKPILQNLKTKPYGGAWCIQDQEAINLINHSLKQFDISKILKVNVNDFLLSYHKWILNSNNKLIGLENFNSLSFSLGTTNSFDMFYITYKDKNFVSFDGEYVYHNIIQRQSQKINRLKKSEDLKKGDALIISAPFADTGSLHEEFEKVLLQCDKLKIPVLIDCAYINICNGITINFKHSCIKAVTSSLSKVFPVGEIRIGIRMTKKDYDDGLDLLTKSNYINLLGVYLGNILIKNFDPDYIFKKYKTQQLDFCQKLSLTPSDCVIFGVDYKNIYQEYNRGGKSNRLCLAKHFLQ